MRNIADLLFVQIIKHFRVEHKLDDLISFFVSAVVLAAAQILQESWRFLFEFTARFASLFKTSEKQNDFAADLCSIVLAD